MGYLNQALPFLPNIPLFDFALPASKFPSFSLPAFSLPAATATAEVQDSLGEINWSSRKVLMHATSSIRYVTNV